MHEAVVLLEGERLKRFFWAGIMGISLERLLLLFPLLRRFRFTFTNVFLVAMR